MRAKRAVSLVTNQVRQSGKVYEIVSDMRKTRIQYIDDYGEISSTTN